MNNEPNSKSRQRAYRLAIAALLHDVGKIGEPAKVELPRTIRNLEQQTCPSDIAGNAQYRHVLYSAHAVEQVADKLPSSVTVESIFQPVAFHHQREFDTIDECLIKKADWLASGHDRRQSDSQTTAAITGLQAIAQSVCWPQSFSSTGSLQLRILPTVPLSFERDRFLPIEDQDRASYSQQCEELWQLLDFDRHFADPSDCVEGLAGWLLRHAHAIPASRSRGQQADVSLFDHSRVVAAFASCLAVVHGDGICHPSKIKGKYRLLSLALGGIQKFLFRDLPSLDEDIATTRRKGMARKLRARSFFVSLLSLMAGRRLLESVDLPMTNLLVDAGGRSLILIPDDVDVVTTSQSTICQLQDWITERLGGLIRLDAAMSGPLSDADFAEDKFSLTFREMETRLREARLKIPGSALRDGEHWNETAWLRQGVSLPIDRSEFQEHLRDVGRCLPKASWLTFDGRSGMLREPLELFGYGIQLHDKPTDPTRRLSLRLRSDDLRSSPLFLSAGHVPVASAENISILSGLNALSEDEPLCEGDILTFEHLARLSTEEDGHPVSLPMLGALKADVDRLGLVFGYGLGEKVSFGRYASLARSLDFFFKGFLTEQLNKDFPLVYTVFAGGDDLFVIGPWYDLIRLAADLQRWFQKMTCGNKNLTFSAGLVFSKPSTPVDQLATFADDALEAAKASGRNRVTVGSHTLLWDQYSRGIALHQQLCEAVQTNSSKGGITGSFVYRLLTYSKMALQSRAGGKPSPSDLKWRAQMSYDVSRAIPLRSSPDDQERQRSSIQRALAEIQTKEDAKVLHLATTLTLYRLRGDAK
jgi:CRISPR-associated protein Csm1